MVRADVGSAHGDEIDVAALWRGLWGARRTIGVITLIVTALACVYAFAVAPVVFETRVVLLPPRVADLAGYNQAHQLSQAIYHASDAAQDSAGEQPTDNAIARITPNQAYRVFQRHLSSASLRTRFLASIQTESGQGLRAGNAAANKALQEALTIELPKSGQDQTVVTWRGKAPVLIARWANQYVHAAMQAARAELLDTLAGEVAMRTRSTQLQSDVVRSVGQVERRFEMARVRDALHIAQAISLEGLAQTPRLLSPHLDEVMYLQGSRALQAQLNALAQRQIDDPFLPQLTPLRQARLMLERIALDPTGLRVAMLDASAQVSQIPVRPQRWLIVLLGAALGLMLGTAVALLRGLESRPAMIGSDGA
ncbi:LPS O-antigen chain length determinant protein WzzB [Pusillimonas sp. T7-7]|uniref:LPS O-antigen chain length determinant protein WzzB n=1 Tax=Pusillimonas sp. (strain T7-7) TaxID=1007105 RepID=UPI0005A2B6C3|nr:Wzz/FepE/Etk N-terminal domain-containing protein [Pusillimonas sp. T7-7]